MAQTAGGFVQRTQLTTGTNIQAISRVGSSRGSVGSDRVRVTRPDAWDLKTPWPNSTRPAKF